MKGGQNNTIKLAKEDSKTINAIRLLSSLQEI